MYTEISPDTDLTEITEQIVDWRTRKSYTRKVYRESDNSVAIPKRNAKLNLDADAIAAAQAQADKIRKDLSK